jgi:hypothetical protein
MAFRVSCVCGYALQANTHDELWAKAEDHLQADHPDLVGKVNRDEFLAQAEMI